MEHHPCWHRHNRAGPQCAVMVEAIDDPAPDLSAGGEEGEVGYAPMKHTQHTPTQNDIPFPPTHTTCPPPHIISCCPLRPVRCIVVGWLVGWLLAWLVGWLLGWLLGCLVGCLVGCLFVC